MAMQEETSDGGPLRGHRVVELCSTIAGPVCARLLADFGAEVVKIEAREGDPGRNFGAQVEGCPCTAYRCTATNGPSCWI